MKRHNKLIISIVGVITVLLITIGLSFAYFTANITGEEKETTITVTGGTMSIVYNGGEEINIFNIIPSNDPAAIKTFTVTGDNTLDLEMQYQINLVIEENNFSEDALKYKLISTNADNNGTIIPSVIELTNIGSGSKTISLGVGKFTLPTNGNKVHTYNLELYFPDTGLNQNEDQGKEFKAYISIKNYEDPCLRGNCLKEAILVSGGGADAISAKGNPNFAKKATILDTGLYSSDDETGTSYYYRGLRENLNNNLIFGGFQWKIIRINGDSSIRIIYNGTEEQFNTNKTMNVTGTNTHIKSDIWNPTNYNDAKYVGYMYGGLNGKSSTSRNGTTSSSATYNQTNSNIKTQIDNWYRTNILNQSFEKNIVSQVFCNDRQLRNEIGGAATGPGYGKSETIYAGNYRIQENKIPSLKCGLKNDRFSTNSKMGNGALTYPVGLITADETSMAGLVYGSNTNDNYLYTNQSYWTATPFYMSSTSRANLFIVNTGGAIKNNNTTMSYGLRVILNLSPYTLITGEGTATNPYRVV